MLRELIKSGLQLFRLALIRAGGLLFLFLANVILARNFGAATLGAFQLALAAVTVLSTVGRLGQDQYLLRAAAQAKAKGEAQAVTSDLASAWRASLLPLAACAVGFIAWIRVFPHDVEFNMPLQLGMALSILPMGLLMIATECMRGQQRVETALFLQSWLPQMLLLAGLGIVVLIGTRAPVLIAASYTMAFAAAAFIAALFWPGIFHARETGFRRAWNHGKHFWAAACLNAATAWIDILVLGVIASSADLGTYAAIIRTGALIGTFIMIVSGPASPTFAALHATEDHPGFAKAYRLYGWILAASALPFAIVLFGFPQTIMKLWNIADPKAVLALQIYAGFQLTQFFIGLPAQITPYVGLERKVAVLNAYSFVIKAAAIVLGYVVFGLIGAVTGAGMALTFFNLGNMWLLLQSRQGAARNESSPKAAALRLHPEIPR